MVSVYKNILDTWAFPKIGVPENGWFIVENPIKMDDLGVPLLLEIPISSIFVRLTCFFSPVGWDNEVLYPIPKGSQVQAAMISPNNRRLAMKLST